MSKYEIITAEHLSHVVDAPASDSAYIIVRVYDDGLITAQSVNGAGLYTARRRNPATRLVQTDYITRPVVLEYLRIYGDDVAGRGAAAAIMAGRLAEYVEHRAERTGGLYSALLRAMPAMPAASGIDSAWEAAEGFNPGASYVRRDGAGRVMWLISGQPDGSLWQLGSNPDMTDGRRFTLHRTVPDAMAAAEAWMVTHG